MRCDRAASEAADIHVKFHLSFDAPSCVAHTDGRPMEPVRQVAAVCESGAIGKALRIGADTELVYAIEGLFPREEGTLEFFLSPAFPQIVTEEAGKVLTLSNAAGESFEIRYVPECRGFWIGFCTGDESWGLQTHYGDLKQGEWNHVVLTWDGKSPDRRPTLNLYFKGEPYTYSKQTAFTLPSMDFTELRFGADDARPVLLDEFILYDRRLTSTQVRLAYEQRKEGVRKLSALGERVRQDAEREADRKRGIEMFASRKKVGLLTWLFGRTPRWETLFDVLPLVEIKPESMGPDDLREFAVLFAPGGGKDDYTPAQWEAIVGFVRRGGGYVGVCKGAYDAARHKLLDFKAHPFREEGVTEVGLQEHPVTEGYDLSIALPMQHGNGPLMEPGPGAMPAGKFKIGPPESNFSAILAGIMPGGKGRVVVFSTHPYGGSVGFSPAGKRVDLTPKELDTERLLINALLWAGRADEPVMAGELARSRVIATERAL